MLFVGGEYFAPQTIKDNCGTCPARDSENDICCDGECYDSQTDEDH